MKLICILPVLLLLASVKPTISTLGRRYDSIFSFGDSFTDTGNDIVVFPANKLVTPAAAAPYGITFFHRATGRNSNGRLIIDFIECTGLFQRSLFFVGEFGFNDYSFAVFGKTIPQLRSMVPEVVKTISTAVEVLIKQGARTVVVPGIAPLGCTPPNLAFFPSANPAGYEPRTGCLKDLNQVAVRHNLLLKSSLNRIRRNHRNVAVVYADFYTPVIQMVESPAKFGLTRDVLRCCCGGGGKYNFNISAGCGMPGATVCKNPSAYLFWDGHFTEKAYSYIAKGWLKSIDSRKY